MLYADTVEQDKLVHKPWFLACVFGAVFLMFFAFNLTGTIFGEFMRPVIGDPAQSGVYGQIGRASCRERVLRLV